MKEIALVEWIEIPRITDPRGNLAVIEGNTLPFKMERVYYLHDVPSDAYRGGHAHRECVELLIAVSGSFEVVLDNGVIKERVTLNKPIKGLLIKKQIWRELDNFSSGAVCLVIASHLFSEDDYIRDYKNFLSESG